MNEQQGNYETERGSYVTHSFDWHARVPEDMWIDSNQQSILERLQKDGRGTVHGQDIDELSDNGLIRIINAAARVAVLTEKGQLALAFSEWIGCEDAGKSEVSEIDRQIKKLQERREQVIKQGENTKRLYQEHMKQIEAWLNDYQTRNSE